MLDARSWGAANANRIRDGGVEDMDRYSENEATLVFLGIGNIRTTSPASHLDYAQLLVMGRF